MRYREISGVNESHEDCGDQIRDLIRDYKAGGISRDEYEKLMAYYERKQGGDSYKPQYRVKPPTLKTYFKIPYDLRDLAKNSALRWDPANKLWYKEHHLGTEYRPAELDQYRVEPPTQSSKPEPASQPEEKPGESIKMTHLHYFRMNQEEADDQIRAGVKLKKDKKGDWYLPQYNKSGKQFDIQFTSLRRAFGDPRTVKLN